MLFGAAEAMDHEQTFTPALEGLRRERRYRIFNEIERDAARFPCAIWQSPDGPPQLEIFTAMNYWRIFGLRDVGWGTRIRT